MDSALKAVHTVDPAGVGARDLRECLLLQIESGNGKRRRGLADCFRPPMRLLEMRQFKELAKVLQRPCRNILMSRWHVYVIWIRGWVRAIPDRKRGIC